MLGVTSYVDPASGVRFENITQTDEAIELDIVIPDAAERLTDSAFAASLRTYSRSFKPESLNGSPW